MNRILNLFNPSQWAILGGIVLILVMTATAVTAKVHHAGKAAGRAEVQAAWDAQRLSQQEAANRSLLNQAEKIAILTNQLMEAERAQNQVTADLARARADAAARARVLRAKAATDQLAADIAAAERQKLNEFASRAYRAALRGRNAVAELGLGAGGLVEATASAYHEYERAEALIRFVMPEPPTGPFGDRQ